METSLKVERRDGAGKGVARKLRAAGRVPGVLYGHGIETTSIQMASQDLLHLFHHGGTSQLIEVQLDGTTHLAIPREIQRDHIRGRYIHVDLLAVSRTEKVTLSVEVYEVGEAAGVRAGGVIEHHLREVELECLPGDVPERIEIDVTALEIGDLLRVADLTPPPGITFLSDPETPLISVIMPAALRVDADLTLPGEEAPEAPAEEEEAPAEAGSEEAESAAEEPAAEGGEG